MATRVEGDFSFPLVGHYYLNAQKFQETYSCVNETQESVLSDLLQAERLSSVIVESGR